MKMRWLLASILVLSGTVLAMEMPVGPEWDNTTLGKLTYAYEAGKLTYEDFLTYRVVAMFAGNIPAQYQGEAFSPVRISGTPLMTEFAFNKNKLSAEQKQLIHKETGIANLFENGNTAISMRFDWDGEYHYIDQAAGNVRVHYETTGTHATTTAMAQQYANDYERAWHDYTTAAPNGMSAQRERDDSPLAGQFINDGGLVPLRDAYNETGETPDSYYTQGDDFGYGPGGTNPLGDNRVDVYIRTMAAGVGAYTQYEYYDPDTTRIAAGYFFATPPGGTDIGTTLHEASHGIMQGFYDVGSESWYKEATSTWNEDELFNHGDGYTLGRCNEFLQNSWLALDYWTNGDTLAGYRCAIWNFFITDYGKKIATPGSIAAQGLYNFWMVRRVWESLAKGDYWYSKDETVDRNVMNGLDFTFDYYDQPTLDYVDHNAMLQKWYTDFVMWNFYTGANHDANHYRYGAEWSGVGYTATYASGDLPLAGVNPFTGGTGALKKPDHLSSSYFSFDGFPAGWTGATFKFTADPTVAEESNQWAGWVFANNGGTWNAHAMHCNNDKGVYRLDLGSSPSAAALCITNLALVGSDFTYTLDVADNSDATAPNVTLALARPNHNPQQFEVVIGANENLFGDPVGYGDFVYSGTHTNTDPDVNPAATTFRSKLDMKLNTANSRSALGVFTLQDPNGSGTIHVEVADVAGNIVSKEKDYSAETLNTTGGNLILDKCKLDVPAGALSEETWFTIIADSDMADAANKLVSKMHNNTTTSESAFFGDAYLIQPAWARLSKDMSLSLSYEGMSVDESRIAILRLEGSTVKNIGGTVDRMHQRVTADIDRPGIYILGLGRNDGFGTGGSVPSKFSLNQNYPNPVSSTTTIRYSVSNSKNTTLKIYSLNGALVRTLVNGPQNAGSQSVVWDCKDEQGTKVASGVYVYTLNADGQTSTRKMVIAH